jgi:hypothetical protein
VTIVAVIVFIQGLIGLIAGIGLVIERNNETLLAHVDVTSSTVAAHGWAAIVAGVVALLAGWGLFGGANWARLLVGIVEVAQAAGGVYMLVAWDGHYRFQALQQIGIALVVLWMLFSAQADRFFESR